jgi:transposase
LPSEIPGTIHQDGVLRFVKHPITNGVAEGLNSKIMSIKRRAGGFRNPQNLTTAICFTAAGSILPTPIPEEG